MTTAPNVNLVPPALRNRRLKLQELEPSEGSGPEVSAVESVLNPAPTPVEVLKPALSLVPTEVSPAPAPVAVQPVSKELVFDERAFMATEDQTPAAVSVTPPSSAAPAATTKLEAASIFDFLAEPESKEVAQNTNGVEERRQLQKTIEAMRQEITTLRETVVTQQQAASQTASVADKTPVFTPAPALTVADFGLSPEETAQYQASLPVIMRVADKIVASHIAGLRQELTTLKQGLTESHTATSKEVSKLSNRAFESQLHAAVPNFEAIIATPEFSNYTMQEVPYSGGTKVKDVLRAALLQREARTIVKLVNEFQRDHAGADKPPLSAFAQPQSTAATPATVVDNSARKPMLLQSKRVKIFADYRAGKITQEQLLQVKDVYAKAEADNRVDYTR